MGHPLSMFKHSDVEGAGKPVISIGLSMITSAGCDGEDRFNQGAAVLAAIEELEMRGYRCELVSTYRTGPSNSRPMNTWANLEVMLKQANEPFNPVAVAFALAHPAWLRRLGFKAMETQPEWSDVTRSCYGDASGGPEWDASMAEDFDIVIPNIFGSGYSTMDKAFKKVTEIFNEAMNRLTENAA